jgi:hypothetical protein
MPHGAGFQPSFSNMAAHSVKNVSEPKRMSVDLLQFGQSSESVTHTYELIHSLHETQKSSVRLMKSTDTLDFVVLKTTAHTSTRRPSIPLDAGCESPVSISCLESVLVSGNRGTSVCRRSSTHSTQSQYTKQASLAKCHPEIKCR